MHIAMSMSMTYIQLIQQCMLAIWGGGVTLNFYRNLQWGLPTYRVKDRVMVWIRPGLGFG